MAHDLLAHAPSLSTQSTDAHSPQSGSSVLEDTSHMVQLGRTVGSVLLDGEGSGDTGVPAPGYVGQGFHLLATCGSRHIGKQSRD